MGFLFSSVNPGVYSKVFCTGKALGAMNTKIVFLPCVTCDFWFLTRMNFEVLLQITTLSKGLLTLITRKGFLPSVNSQMASKDG
jgi:hypothetical protein